MNFTFQEGSSSDSNILVKHLQEELRNYVSLVSSAFMPLHVCLLLLYFFGTCYGVRPSTIYKFVFHSGFPLYCVCADA